MKYHFASRMDVNSSDEWSPLWQHGQMQREKMISFADEWFENDCYALEALYMIMHQVLQEHIHPLLDIPIEGDKAVRQAIMRQLLRDQALQGQGEHTMLTAGRQQTIELFARVILEPGDVVCVENPIPPALLQVIQMSGAQAIVIQSDSHGMIPEDIEAQFKLHHPKFVYVVPSSESVAGRIWSKERRVSLLKLCKAYHALILEDDPEGELGVLDSPIPRIAEIEGIADDRIVVYTSSFGKGVVPGLQLGFIAADERVISQLKRMKQRSGACSSVWEQMILKVLLTPEKQGINQQLKQLTQRSQACMDIIEEHLQKKPAWQLMSKHRSQGGMYYRIGLPSGLNAQSVLRCAWAKHTLFVPEMYIDKQATTEQTRQYIRLSCTLSDPELIHRGMEHLSEAVNEFLGRYSQ